VAQDFAAYQSDGMLLEASLVALFWGPGARLPLFLVRWEWFRIYFESGLVKLLSGEEQWRNLTAMDKYYENGPLPTWLAWYAQQRLGHGFHAATVLLTLAVELVVPWCMFAPRRVRLAAFALTALLQIGIISTANYAFLNYLMLLLGVALCCDWPPRPALPRWRRQLHGVAAGLLMYCTVAAFAVGGWLAWPARLLAPLRVANAYGLFAVMTRERHESEFQGTMDGEHWVAYPFRFKPQDIQKAPGIYAPYQPRFDWDLWFASLDEASAYPWVETVERRLLECEPTVLRLFAGDPFGGRRPRAVRTVLWQYWFTTPAEKRASGAWWRREERGSYAPEISTIPDEPAGQRKRSGHPTSLTRTLSLL
jgi:uncharacterized membrane protein YphA (DoxX/SURF4 family)